MLYFQELGTVDLERYWNPLCYIDNILSETKEVQWLSTTVGQGGEVYIIERRRIKGVFLETLELNDFPLDVQVKLRSVFICYAFIFATVIMFKWLTVLSL